MVTCVETVFLPLRRAGLSIRMLGLANEEIINIPRLLLGVVFVGLVVQKSCQFLVGPHHPTQASLSL